MEWQMALFSHLFTPMGAYEWEREKEGECGIEREMNTGFAGSLVWISDGKYRYNEISININTSGTVIDKYRYFPFILFLADMFAL